MAIKMGYHHLDGAEVYNTERELGTAIKESGVPREKLFVTTKVIVNIADIPGAINTSLEKLGLDYVDLYVLDSLPNTVDISPLNARKDISSTPRTSPKPPQTYKRPGPPWKKSKPPAKPNP